MAEVALSFAVEKLGNLLIQKVEFLQGVEEKLKQLKDELEWMQCFLKDASQKRAKDDLIRKWISDIRDLAHDTEDVIDSFALRVDAPRKSQPLLRRCVCFPQHVNHLGKLGKKIESIQKCLKEIDTRRERYGITGNHDDGIGQSSIRRKDGVERRRRVSPWIPDKHVVGLEPHVETLLRKSVSMEKEGLFVGSIVGMGGVGKSTLAKKVYNHTTVSHRFECLAWVTVSRDFCLKELMKEVMNELMKNEATEEKLKVLDMMDKSSEQTVKQMVYHRLQGKRYFIVVDDVWRQQDWEDIKIAFPDEQEKGSMLLITSRDNSIPRGAHYIHKLNGLDDEQSWKLFLKTAFVKDVNGKCPPELEETGKQILGKCNGLPLAITVVGGLLLEQGEFVSGWKKVLRGIKSYLGDGKDSVGAVLELSYQDLPSQLKSCFLCLSFFKEDAVIHASALVQMWIAEGFVPQDENKSTMEDVAWSYLEELINRNMIQGIKFPIWKSQVVGCKIHDLLHDLSITKAREEINFNVLREENTCATLDKVRHLAIYCWNKSFMMSRDSNSHIRSLFFHGSGRDDDAMACVCLKNFENLRVLKLIKVSGLTKRLEMVGALISLRYLEIKSKEMERLPTSIGDLNNLEVLNFIECYGNRVKCQISFGN